MTQEAAFHADILLEGARIVAVRVDSDLVVREVVGDWCEIPLGGDIRDAVPALIGMEEEFERPEPDVHLPFVTPDPDLAPVAITVTRENGAVWVLLRDVTKEAAVQWRLVQQHNALSIAQQELAAARDAALAADRAKTAFLGNISHELRTPLNVVIGNASLLLKFLEKPIPADELLEYVRDIQDSGELLLKLVEDLIDLSRAETGNLVLYEEWCSIPAIAAEIIRMVRALPDAAGITIKLEPAEKPVPEFFADPTRLRQILINLLSNAAKVCGAGNTVTVQAQRDGAEGDLLLSVSDDGPGMSAQNLAIALEPFGQPKSATRSKGAGLGLAIVTRLAELHEGSLEVETQTGEGLTATVRLPGSRFAGQKAP